MTTAGHMTLQGMKVCRHNWHSAGSGTLGWPFPMLKYKYIFNQCFDAVGWAAGRAFGL